MKNILATLCIFVLALTCYYFLKFLETRQASILLNSASKDSCEIEIIKKENDISNSKYEPLTLELLLMVEGENFQNREALIQRQKKEEELELATVKATKKPSNVELHKQSMELLKKIREQN